MAAILATKPTTPAECVQAAKTLADLGHAGRGQAVSEESARRQVDAAAIGRLGRGVRRRDVSRLGRPSRRCCPRPSNWPTPCWPPSRRSLEDAKRIAELIRQLQDPDEQKRIAALAGLQEARQAAIGPLLAVLADPARAAEHANVRTVLAGDGQRLHASRCWPSSTRPTPKLKVQAILTLAEMNSRKVALALLEPCLVGKSDAEVRAAAAAALRQLTGSVPTRPEAIAPAHRCRQELFRPPAADRRRGRRPGRAVAMGRGQAAMRGPKRHAGRRRPRSWPPASPATPTPRPRQPRDSPAVSCHDARCGGVRQRAWIGRWTKRIRPSAEAKQFGAKTLDDVLAYAMAHRHPAAATAAARLAGRNRQRPTSLLYQGDKPSPLVRALQDPDRRLRMAALEAIVRLQPSKPYRRLELRAGGVGLLRGQQRHAPRAGRAARTSSNRATWPACWPRPASQTDTATTGQELLRLATRSPDYEVAWIDVSINHPEIGTLLQELRRDPRTASLRVGLMARAGTSSWPSIWRGSTR